MLCRLVGGVNDWGLNWTTLRRLQANLLKEVQDDQVRQYNRALRDFEMRKAKEAGYQTLIDKRRVREARQPKD